MHSFSPLVCYVSFSTSVRYFFTKACASSPSSFFSPLPLDKNCCGIQLETDHVRFKSTFGGSAVAGSDVEGSTPTEGTTTGATFPCEEVDARPRGRGVKPAEGVRVCVGRGGTEGVPSRLGTEGLRV